MPALLDAPLDGSAALDATVALDAAAALDAPLALDAPVEPPIVIDDRLVPPEAALYTLDGTRYGIHEIGAALDATATGADNVILYVHGRGCGGGGEPAKSLAEAMPEMARDYTAVPILLFWPGSGDSCPLGFPADRALAAGVALAVVAADLHSYLLAHPAFAPRLTLITHSMGSLVLEGAAAVPGVERLPSSLFDTVVVSAGASAADGHAGWLSTIRFSPALYVATNEGDNVLRASELGRSDRLGRGVAGVPLAAGTSYVDFTANDVNHAYYLPSSQSGAAMRALYLSVMNGLPYDLETASGIASRTSRDGARLYVFDGT